MTRLFAIVVERDVSPPDYAAVIDGQLWYTSALKAPDENHLCSLSALPETIAVVRDANPGAYVAAYEAEFINPAAMRDWWTKKLQKAEETAQR